MRTDITPASVLFPLGLGTALSLMGDATLYTILPTHTQAVGITLTQVGVMLGINRAVRLITNGMAGMVYDRCPRRMLFLPALFLGAISTATYALSRSFWPLFFGRLLWGIAWSGIWVGGTTMILDVTSIQNRGKWAGLYQVWFFIGTAIGSLSGGFFTDYLGYYGTMWVCTAVTLFGALVAMVLLPETRPDLRGHRLLLHKSRERSKQSFINQIFTRKINIDEDKIFQKELTFVILMRGVNRFVIAGVLSATLSLLARDYIFNGHILLGVATLTGLLMAGRTMMSILGSFLAGFASDFLANRWVVLASGLSLSVISMILLSSQTTLLIILGIGLAATARGTVQSMTTSITGDMVPLEKRGRVVGILHTVGDLGSAIGPSAAYFLLPLWGLSTVYRLCAAIFGVCLVVNIIILMKEPIFRLRSAHQSPLSEIKRS